MTTSIFDRVLVDEDGDIEVTVSVYDEDTGYEDHTTSISFADLERIWIVAEAAHRRATPTTSVFNVTPRLI